jgi:hypothetical protein
MSFQKKITYPRNRGFLNTLDKSWKKGSYHDSDEPLICKMAIMNYFPV